jgi:hypothetical protein
LALEGEGRAPKKSQENTLFISYAREDFDGAKRLYNDLKSAGLNAWLDKEELLPGQQWQLEIRKAIKNSAYFLAVLSSNSVEKRGYVQKEFKFGLEVLDEVPESQIFVIPARLNECNVPEKLRKYQYVDLFPDWETGLRRILQAMGVQYKKLEIEELQSANLPSMSQGGESREGIANDSISAKMMYLDRDLPNVRRRWWNPLSHFTSKIEITKVFPLEVTRGQDLSIFGSNFGSDRQDVWLGTHRIGSADKDLIGWSDGRIDIRIPDIPDPLRYDGYEIMVTKGGSSKIASTKDGSPIRIKILSKWDE